MPKLINGIPPISITARAAGAGESAFWSTVYDFMKKNGYAYKYGDIAPGDAAKLQKAMEAAVVAFVTQNADSLQESTEENLDEGSKEEYQKVFNAALKKFGVDTPADFDSDEEKKKFFDYVDKNYEGTNESIKPTPTKHAVKSFESFLVE